ncbi:MAG: integrase [Pseudomonadales bacterium]|nr:integrase [Pseudomonadales bacterium]MCP5128674.1 integrase [Pseudomonadales bacterium]MCP5128890.1 integrase [Pseudomonadales bacterium]
MGKNERQAYLKAIRPRYRKAHRRAKAAILNEFCAVCGYHRKYAIRLLNQPRRGGTPGRGGRPATYASEALRTALKRIWFATDQMCSKKLKAALPLWLPGYEAVHQPLAADTRAQLLAMSPATIDRLLRPIRARRGRKGLCGTRPGSLLKNQIPIRTEHWDVTQPGFMEADTVAHCGNSLAGDFAWSLTLTDILTGWTEIRATWNKGAVGVCNQIKAIEAALPFDLRGFDCDNGSEFLNYHLQRYFSNRPREVAFTRSRPYRKNDNAHVEQKNWTHVRQLFGYDRIDDVSLIPLMNDLYAHEWSLYQNHFCPAMKLVEKQRVNARYRKKYDVPKTPYQRLLGSDHLTDEMKGRLRDVHGTLNPFILKQAIETKLRRIFRNIRVTSNVRQRL